MSTTYEARAGTLRGHVAGEVRAFMARHGLSQVRLAELLGWRQPYLSRRLTGSVPFDTDDLSALAEVFEVQPETFFRGPRGKVLSGKFVHWCRRINYITVITCRAFAASLLIAV